MLDRDIHDICDLYIELLIKSTNTTLIVRSLHLDNGGECNSVIIGGKLKN